MRAESKTETLGDQRRRLGVYRGDYLDAFVRSRCAPDLLAARVFPDAKEITESWALFESTLHLPEPFRWDNPHIIVAVVGDGRTPRTAATFAMRSKWEARSIDPDLDVKMRNIQRLLKYPQSVEKVEFDFKEHYGLLIVMPHSHAPLKPTLENLKCRGPRALITMDCCVEHRHTAPPAYEYADEHVWSPKNVIRIWPSI